MDPPLTSEVIYQYTKTSPKNNFSTEQQTLHKDTNNILIVLTALQSTGVISSDTQLSTQTSIISDNFNIALLL